VGNLGAAWGALRDFSRAIGFFEQNQTIAREISDPHGEAYASFNLALALAALRQEDRAVPHAERALGIFQTLGSAHAETVRRKLGAWRGRT
jgi:tetratricopeptide (TPR) repeat protein